MSPPTAERLRGLYAVTPDWPDTARLEAAVADALRGGAVMIQYRNKSADGGLRREQASALQALCAAAGVPLIVNDDLALALEIGAAGVHLGRDDGSIESARARLGGQRLLGVSCYDSIERVRSAQAAGADIVGIGAMFASGTKPAAVPAPLDLLRQARECGVVVAAIGGITLDNAPRVIAAGADLLAVVSDLFDNPDIAARAAAYAALFASMESHA